MPHQVQQVFFFSFFPADNQVQLFFDFFLIKHSYATPVTPTKMRVSSLPRSASAHGGRYINLAKARKCVSVQCVCDRDAEVPWARSFLVGLAFPLGRLVDLLLLVDAELTWAAVNEQEETTDDGQDLEEIVFGEVLVGVVFVESPEVVHQHVEHTKNDN